MEQSAWRNWVSCSCGHKGAPVLLPGFAIKWQVHLCDLTHIKMPPNSSGNMQKHGYSDVFRAVAARDNISRFYLIPLFPLVLPGPGEYVQAIPQAYAHIVFPTGGHWTAASCGTDAAMRHHPRRHQAGQLPLPGIVSHKVTARSRWLLGDVVVILSNVQAHTKARYLSCENALMWMP